MENLEQKYIWFVHNDYRGIVGCWDTREGAVAEVERLNKKAGWYKDDTLCYDNNDEYGYEIIYATRFALNKQW